MPELAIIDGCLHRWRPYGPHTTKASCEWCGSIADLADDSPNYAHVAGMISEEA